MKGDGLANRRTSKAMSRKLDLEAADIFFALGDRTRLSVLNKLGSGAQSATALASGAKVSRQAIVKHLQVLEGAGLVTHEKRGREVLYLVDSERIREAQSYLDMVSVKWDEAIDRLKKSIEKS